MLKRRWKQVANKDDWQSLQAGLKGRPEEQIDDSRAEVVVEKLKASPIKQARIALRRCSCKAHCRISKEGDTCIRFAGTFRHPSVKPCKCGGWKSLHHVVRVAQEHVVIENSYWPLYHKYGLEPL